MHLDSKVSGPLLLMMLGPSHMGLTKAMQLTITIHNLVLQSYKFFMFEILDIN